MCGAGNPNPVFCDNLEGLGWRRRWEGGSGEMGNMYAYGQFMLMYGGAITYCNYPPIKINTSKFT